MLLEEIKSRKTQDKTNKNRQVNAGKVKKKKKVNRKYLDKAKM